MINPEQKAKVQDQRKTNDPNNIGVAQTKTSTRASNYFLLGDAVRFGVANRFQRGL
jgi:hypothetical protein